MAITIKNSLGNRSKLILTCSGVGHEVGPDGWTPNQDELFFIFANNPDGPGYLSFCLNNYGPSYMYVEDNLDYEIKLIISSPQKK